MDIGNYINTQTYELVLREFDVEVMEETDPQVYSEADIGAWDIVWDQSEMELNKKIQNAYRQGIK